MEALKRDAESSPEGRTLLKLLGSLKLPKEQLAQLATDILAYKRIAGPQETHKVVQNGVKAKPVSEGLADTGPPKSSIDALQVITPSTVRRCRGRYDLQFYGPFAQLKGAKQSYKLPISCVHSIAIFDRIPKDSRKRVLLYIGLEESNGITPDLKSLIIQVAADAKLDVQSPISPSRRLTGLAAVVLCQAFGEVGVDNSAFVAPTKDCFCTSSGQPAVEALMGVNDGWLFPLPAALCFVERPATFIRHADISQVETGRTGNMTRSFVLYVHLKSGKVIEFNNIPQEDLSTVLAYLAKSKLQLKSEDGEGDSAPENEAGSQEDSDDSEEADSDFDPQDPGSAVKQAPKRQKLARGSSEAEAGGEGAEEEEDNEEESSEEDSEDGSESDSDVSVVSEEGVPSTKVKDLVADAKTVQKKRKR